jgi:hypothetical protein
MCQLAVDLHYPETVFGAVLPHVHPFPDCALDMSDLGAMLHHLLHHSQTEHCATLAVYEVHHFGSAWSPQQDLRMKAVLKCAHIWIHHTSHLDVLAPDSESPSPQYSRIPNKDCCYYEKGQEFSVDPDSQTYNPV